MYQALYRKYRPKSFEDVVGQNHVTLTLQNELQSGRIGHAYLFIGSRGTGKTTCAKILAKAVNCLSLNQGNPCGVCEVCRDMDSGEIMDVVELDAASNNSVNDIREICDSAAFTPARAKYRVYIIDEVHMLSPGAFNALLKTLEEPPSYVIFILATTEAHKIPATILSRCQRFEFHRISVENIAQRIEFVAENENVKIEHSAALLIARIADGAMRDALAILDKCISVENNVTVDVVTKIVGMASQEHLNELSAAMFDACPEKALIILNDLNQQSKDMLRLTQELIGHFRNIMLIKTVDNPLNLLNISKLEYDEIFNISKNISLDTIIYILDTLQASFEKMNRGCDSKTELEMCMVKLCTPGLNVSLEALVARMDKLEKLVNSINNVDNVVAANASPQVVENVSHGQTLIKNSSSNNNTGVDLSDLQKNAEKMSDWKQVLDVLKSFSNTVALAFKNSQAYVSGDFVLIDSDNELAFELLRKSSQRDKMRAAIKQVTGKAYKLGPYNSGKKNNEVKDPLKELADSARQLGINVTEI